MRKDQRDKIVETARKRLSEAQSYDQENRDKAFEDLRFAFSGDPEDQWEEPAWKARENRPRLTYNRIEPALDQMIGDQRQNRPQIKVRATEDGDTDAAETFAGLIRNIEAQSVAESVYDHAYMYAAAAGMGAWQVCPEYSDDDSFDQDIRIKLVHNPFSVYFDPAAEEATKSDARWAIVSEWIADDEFDTKYKGKQKGELDTDTYNDWVRKDRGVRIADFWEKIPRKRTLIELSDGKIVYKDTVENILDELEEAGITVLRERVVDAHKIRWTKVSGADVLEGPIEYDWKYIPVVPVYGKRFNIGGREVYKGIVRNAKDPQRSLNYSRSSLMEVAALSPKSPYLMTPDQVKGWEGLWNQAHRENRTWLPYNPTPDAQKPFREQSPGIPAELIQLAQQDIDDIKAITGRHDASLGAASNETSGRAILARQREGDVGSFVYTDNLVKSIAHTGRILVDMIPKIYDTRRTVRVLGVDSQEKFVELNSEVVDEETGETVRVNDLGRGKFDVEVTTGPSYTTQRQEASERLLQLVGAAPQMLSLMADIVIKGLDIPDQDELVSRLRRQMIANGVIEPGDNPEEQALVQQGPDPMQQLMQQLQLRQINAEVQKTEAEAAEKAGEAQKVPVEIEKLAAEVVKILADAQAARNPTL